MKKGITQQLRYQVMALLVEADYLHSCGLTAGDVAQTFNVTEEAACSVLDELVKVDAAERGESGTLYYNHAFTEDRCDV